MTSFAHIEPSAEPRGRAPLAPEASRIGIPGLVVRVVVVAAVVLLAIASRLTTREIDGGWMVAWIAVCAIAFGAMALSAHKLSPLLARMGDAYRASSARRAAARADARFLEHAKYDPRILLELQAAVTRQQSDGEGVGAAAAQVQALTLWHQRSQDVRMPTLYEAMTRVPHASRRD